MYFIISYLCQMCWSWSPWYSSKVEIILMFIAPILQEYAKHLMFYRSKKDTAMSCGWSLLALPAVLKGWSFWQSVHCLNLNSATFWDLKINLSRHRMCQYIHLPISACNLPSTAPGFLTTTIKMAGGEVEISPKLVWLPSCPPLTSVTVFR